VPSLITPEIQPPNRGHALYVFALPPVTNPGVR
jgi:hypothetical protein